MHLVAIGGSDAGISAALRARELQPNVEVTVIVADAFPNYSICGIPYHISGDVPDWHDLAHRTIADLQATGMRLQLETTAERIDAEGHKVHVRTVNGDQKVVEYDRLVVGTGAVSVRPSIEGMAGLASDDGVHLLHSMEDTFAVMDTLTRREPRTALIVGAGYLGLEMAEALISRGLAVTQVEQLPEALPTVDPELGRLVADQLREHGVEFITRTVVTHVERAPSGATGRFRITGTTGEAIAFERYVDVVLAFVGVQPDTELAAAAGATLGVKGAINVDREMRTNLSDVFAAGDCVATYHRLLGATYLPLGTTAHKQGRIAGENAVGGHREYAGSLGTQVVKVFEMVAARTGLRDHEPVAAGFEPVTVAAEADDHKAYYPGSHRIAMRWTVDRPTRRVLGVQMFGHRHAEVAKRIDIVAAALFNEMTVDAMSDLDLSYTPPLGSPWEAVQMGAQAWVRAVVDAPDRGVSQPFSR